MNRKYNLRLDLQFRCNNSVMKFRQSDNKTSDFFIRITNTGELVNIDKAIVILAVIKPNQVAQSQFLEIKEGKIYADLNANMKDQVGIYKAQALLIYEDERVSTDVIEYEVTEDNILNKLETAVSSTEEFTMLKEMLSRLSVIENSENERIENEKNRVEAEKLREQAIEKIKEENASLIATTKKEINDYKEAKDLEISQNLEEYKEQTTNYIDSYKSSKDIEINRVLEEYKEQTTSDIEEFKRTKSQELDSFKNTKNNEIDNYKKEKDLAINKYIESKNLELENFKSAKNSEIDEYKEAKDREIDLYKSNKDTLINNKITEVEAAKQNIISTANNKIDELEQTKLGMQNEVNSKIEEADLRIEELVGYEEEINNLTSKTNEHSTRLNSVEYKNKVQDTYLNGLFNENKNGRLSINGEGNSLKLEGSKEGIVEVESIEGNTLVNLAHLKSVFNEYFSDRYYNDYSLCETSRIKLNTDYTIVLNVEFLEGHSPNYNYFELGCGNSLNTIEEHPSIQGSAFNFAIKQGINLIKLNFLDFKNMKYLACRPCRRASAPSSQEYCKVNISLTLLEGDYTSKPLPNYFEGMLSSFEEHKITEEDVREGTEIQDNLGKYRCNVKVIGKNIVNPKELNIVKKWQCESKILEDYGIEIKPTSTEGVSFIRLSKVLIPKGKVFKLSTKHSGNKSNTFIWESGDLGTTNPVDISNPSSVDRYVDLGLYVDNSSLSNKVVYYVQIEEVESAGSPTTEYEPYYETNQVVYLNNPLLKGDKIVYKEDGLYHCHTREQFILDENLSWNLDSNTLEKTNRFNVLKCLPKADLSTNIQVISTYLTSKDTTYNKDVENIQIIDKGTVYIRIDKTKATNVEALKTYLKQNPIPIIYGLKEPTYEKILDSKFVVDIPNNATLSLDCIIPCVDIKASYTGNVPNIYGIEDSILDIENHNLEMVATTFDMDYRLLEVEWSLEDAGIVGINLNILNKKAGGNTMALSRYEQAKIMIIGGAYDKTTLTKQLTRYLEKNVITKEEYSELIALMEAKELVTGE